LSTGPDPTELEDELQKALEKEAEVEGRLPAEMAVRAIRCMLEAKTVTILSEDESEVPQNEERPSPSGPGRLGS